tara:strand:- start:475 stop:801 length:327 start_codon:yes stop_codon:yes gene_type:complete
VETTLATDNVFAGWPDKLEDNMTRYIICSASVDGMGMSNELTKDQVTKHLNERQIEAEEYDPPMQLIFAESVQDFDKQREHVGDRKTLLLVIKGSTIVPKQVISYDVG